MYPEFILGAAWQDAASRLAMKKLHYPLLPAHSASLEAAAATALSHGKRVAGLQRLHAEAAGRSKVEQETGEMGLVSADKVTREVAAVFEATNRRRPWVTQGKRYIGPTLEERQLAARTRDSMVLNSFKGAAPLI